MDDLFSAAEQDERANVRRLPVYLLLDTSGSMQRDNNIGQVQDGVEMFKRVLLGIPEAVQTVHVKVIQFNSTVTETPLTLLEQFQPPRLSASGETRLGAALRQFNEAAQFGHDLIQNTASAKGDWLPIAFILTDGAPTDQPQEYSAAANAVLRRMRSQQMSVFAIAIGREAAVPEVTTRLHEITDNVLQMADLREGQIAELFQWLSQSVAQRSRAVSAPQAAGAAPPPTPLPPPPPGLVIV